MMIKSICHEKHKTPYIGSPERSEGFPRTGYFIPGRDGMGAWQISGVIHAAARAFFYVREESILAQEEDLLLAQEEQIFFLHKDKIFFLRRRKISSTLFLLSLFFVLESFRRGAAPPSPLP